MELPFDMIILFFDLLNFTDQLNFRNASKYFMKNFPITNMYDDISHINRLTYKILKAYPYITKLNIKDTKIKNINHLKNLQILKAKDWSFAY